jgi:hypothetical protein
MPMGRISRSWELVKQSFAILKSDKQLALLPVISTFCCLLVTSMVAFWGWLSFAPGFQHAAATGARYRPDAPSLWITMFLFYLANYFVIVFFNVALISAASERLAGRPATLGGGLSVAWERKWQVLQWAFLAATVGMILKIIEERVGLLGRLIAKMIGVAWTLASYFVAPILAFEGLGPVDALQRSARLFRENWGEDVVGSFSIGLIFMFLAVAGIGLWIAVLFVGGVYGLLIGGALLLLYLVALSVTSAAVQGIFMAALYRYATTKTVPAGFTPTNFSMAWTRKSK